MASAQHPQHVRVWELPEMGSVTKWVPHEKKTLFEDTSDHHAHLFESILQECAIQMVGCS
jgi:hypothetical protein